MATKTKDKPLSARQRLLIDELPKHGWIFSKAGVAAGYSEVYAEHQLAHRMLGNVTFSKALDAKRKEIERETGRTGAQVVKELWEIMAEARADHDKPSALRAAELLARHYGVFEQDNTQRRNQLGMVIM